MIIIDLAFKEIDRNVPMDIRSIHNESLEMFAFFNMKIIDALVKCTKLSLEEVKRRATSLIGSKTRTVPIMKTQMDLQIPNAVINPSLDGIQHAFAQVINNIVNTHKYVYAWGQRDTILKGSLKHSDGDDQIAAKNYYKIVAENKEIIRIFLSLQGAMYLLKPDVVKLLKVF